MSGSGVSLIDDLIAEYGPGGVLVVDPYVIGEGIDDWRYVVTIGNAPRSDLDVRTVDPPATPGMTLVDDEGRELVVWPWTMDHPKRVLRRLSDLQGLTPRR